MMFCRKGDIREREVNLDKILKPGYREKMNHVM